MKTFLNVQKPNKWLAPAKQINNIAMRRGMLILCSCMLITIASCKKSSPVYTPVCDGTNSTYNANIKPIIDASCVSCHSGYNTYSGIKKQLDNGKFEKHVITNQDMPQGSSLTEDQLNKIKCWIEAGYPEN